MIGNRNAKLLAAVAATGLMFAAQSKANTVYTWINPATDGGTYTFSTAGNWSPGALPAGGNANLQLEMNGTVNLQAKNDMGTLSLNRLDLNWTDSQTTTISSGTFNFVNNSAGVAPVINVYTPNAFRTTLQVNSNLTINYLAPGSGSLAMFSGDITGNGTLTYNAGGGGTWDIESNYSFTGGVVVSGQDTSGQNPILEIIPNGSSTTFANASSFTMNPGATFRIGTGSGTATVPVFIKNTANLTLNGGNVIMYPQTLTGGAAGSNLINSFNQLALGPGYGRMSLSRGSTENYEMLSPTSVVRSQGAIVAVLASDSLNGNGLTGATNVRFLSGDNFASYLIGGGGAPGSTNVSIIPWMIASATAGTSASQFSGLATYDTRLDGSGFAMGVRALTSSEYNLITSGNFTTNTVGSTDNVMLGTGNAIEIAAPQSINALVINSGGSTNINSGGAGTPQTLTVTSGEIQFAAGSSLGTGHAGSANAEQGVIDFGTAEGIIFDNSGNTNEIRTTITGSKGLSKGGLGTLILSGTDTYSGNTTVGSGTMQLGNSTFPGVLSNSVNVNVVSLSTLTILNNGSALAANAVLQADGTVNANGPLSIATLNGAGKLNAGAVSLTNGGAFSGSFANGASTGSLALSGGILTLSGSNTYSGGTSVTGGTLVVAGTSALPTNSALSVTSPGSVVVNRSGGSRITVDLASLSNTGLIDLQNNTMVLHSANPTIAAAVQSQLQSGFNGGGWNGTSGIISSSAQNSPLYTLGEVLNNVTNNVTVAYTLYGDTDLSGTIDGTDYSVVDANNGTTSGGTWQTGDFNYDGHVDGSDYSLIDNAFNTQNGSNAVTASQIAVNTSEIAGASAAVPEPASLGLLSMGAMSLMSRRRRRA